MTIKIINQTPEKLKLVSDMSVNLANAIRRSVLEIPILAIEDVEIIKNDSALFDEIIAHRLGLIPIRTDNSSLKEQQFKLSMKGPCKVYSTDISPSVGTPFKIPITLLGEGQELELNATAIQGKGIEHIKFSPGLFYYKNNLREDLLDFISIDRSGEISYDEEELKEKGIPKEKIEEIKKLKSIPEIEINIESWGQIDSKDIFIKSIEVLDKNLTELSKIFK